ncbi:MAG TPA: hypothetical protein VFS00_06680, partial [Polyangiaceae bacterium]|nr:hypothetical protein [Polyangiaceae bacterium]
MDFGNGLPLAEAAAFFIGIRKFASAPEPAYDDPVEADRHALRGAFEAMVEEEKTAAADQTDPELAETGRRRAIANLASGFTSDEHTRGERAGDLVGRLAGAAAGGLGGRHLTAGQGPALALAGVLGGATLGQHLGARAGKMVGQEADAAAFKSKYASNERADRLRMKIAFDEVSLEQYVAEQQHAEQHANQQASVFYRQRVAELTQQLQAAQAELEELRQAQEVQVQSQQHMMAEAQQTEQAALANAQAAHAAASEAMQSTLNAQSEALQHQQAAARLREVFQGFRQQLLDLADQVPAPGDPALAGAPSAPPGMGPGAPDPTAGMTPAPQQAQPAMAAQPAQGAPAEPQPADSSGGQSEGSSSG